MILLRIATSLFEAFWIFILLGAAVKITGIFINYFFKYNFENSPHWWNFTIYVCAFILHFYHKEKTREMKKENEKLRAEKEIGNLFEGGTFKWLNQK